MVTNNLVSSGILRDKKMNDKLKYTTPMKIYLENYPFYRLR